MPKSTNKLKNCLITIWIVLGVTIILGFFIFSFMIGGSALNGYTKNDSFFVQSHSNITEVSQTIFKISRIWHILFFIFLPLTPLGAFLISFVFQKQEQKAYHME